MFMEQKKKEKEICDDTFLFILLFAMHALSRGEGGGGKGGGAENKRKEKKHVS